MMPASHPEKIPRPPNSFMCFRSARAEHAAATAARGAVRQDELSKAAGAEWRALAPAARAHYVRIAAEKKEAHLLLHPEYKYQPRRGPRTRSDSESRSRSRNRAAHRAMPLDPNFTTRPPSAAPAPYSPFPSGSSTPATWYVSVPTATFARLVNAPQPPSRTVSPALLRAPHLLAYSSLHELAAAVSAPLSTAAAYAKGLFVPVPVRGAGATVEAYPSMRALQAAGAVVDGAPEVFLDPMVGIAEAAAALEIEERGRERERRLRCPDGPVPFLGEETSWPGLDGHV